jgi:hypothetical protein
MLLSLHESVPSRGSCDECNVILYIRGKSYQTRYVVSEVEMTRAVCAAIGLAVVLSAAGQLPLELRVLTPVDDYTVDRHMSLSQ